MSRAVRVVTDALAARLSDYVFLPDGLRQKAVSDGFQAKFGMPGIVGAIDGTHVRIQRPINSENEFVNRKSYHSINVQAICDHEGYFINLVANWPGSTHDSRILSESDVGQMFESGEQSGILLGDSGYPAKHWLLTPFLQPQTPAQSRYNGHHTRTRNVILTTFSHVLFVSQTGDIVKSFKFCPVTET